MCVYNIVHISYILNALVGISKREILEDLPFLYIYV